MMNGMATAGRRLEEMAQQMSQMESDGVAGEHMKVGNLGYLPTVILVLY
jgi:hypothetical protein